MNTEICLSMTGWENLKSAFDLCGQIHSKVQAYKVENNTMILYWSDKGKDIQKLPYPMTMEQCARFVFGWLDQSNPDGRKPDTDGSVGKGWSLYARDFAVYGSETYSFVTITPVWFVYGK